MNERFSTALLVLWGVVQFAATLVTVGALWGWSVTNPFAYMGDSLLRQFENAELVLVMGVAIYLLSTVFLVAVLEKRRKAQHRSGRSALWGLLPILGIAAFFFVRNQGGVLVGDAPPGAPGQPLAAAVSLGLAGILGLGGVFLVAQIPESVDAVAPVSAAEANRLAFRALLEIREAQAAYQLKDWDEDGHNEFALFVVHLWRTGRLNNAPAEVNLIPEALAVSRSMTLAYHGYSFRNLHFQAVAPPNPQAPPVPEEAHLRKLDYRREWALFAERSFVASEDDPAVSLQFLAFSDGRIFARHTRAEPILFVPFGFETQWSLVSSPKDIDALQNKAFP